MPQVIKVELVAKRLRISRATLYRLIKIGKYPQPDRFTWNNRPNWGTYIKKYKEIYVRQFETV